MRDCIASTLPSASTTRLISFTITTSLPDESGPLHGIRIAELSIPGRLARLVVVAASESEVRLVAQNVHAIELDERYQGFAIHLDGTALTATGDRTTVSRGDSNSWRMLPLEQPVRPRRMGPLIQILDGRSPLLVVHPASPWHAARAARLVTAIQLQGGPRVSALASEAAMRPEMARQVARSGLVLLGGPWENELMRASLAQLDMPGAPRTLGAKASPQRFITVFFPASGVFAMRDRVFQQPGYGAVWYASLANAMLTAGTQASSSPFPIPSTRRFALWRSLAPTPADSSALCASSRCGRGRPVPSG